VATDDEWFAQLYDASYPRLVVIALAFTGDLSEAEDVVQEAFLRAYARRGRLATVHNPEAWICTVAMNVARRRHRRRAMADRLLLRRAQDPSNGAGEGRGRGRDTPDPDLMAAISALPEAQRTVVVLHYLADLPVAEVAVRTGVPEGTVKSRLARAREALHHELDADRSPGVADANLLQEADDGG